MAEELKACPFCGSTMDGEHSDSCYFTVDSKFRAAAAKNADLSLAPAVLKAWNTRAQLPSQWGEAVGVWLQSSNKERYADLLVIGNPDDIYAGAYDTKIPLYTQPADQVAGVRLDGLVLANLQMGRVYLHFKTTEQQHGALRELRALLNGGQGKDQ